MLASKLAQSIRWRQSCRTDGSTAVAAFAETLERNPDATLEHFLNQHPTADLDELANLVELDLHYGWIRGKPQPIETYFTMFPEIQANRRLVLDLIYAEYCERGQIGEDADCEDYYRRFPQYQDSLANLFNIDSLFPEDVEAVERIEQVQAQLPQVNERFLDFQLVAELGRGAFGRVFLAKQTSLANRLVVLKITQARSIEHQTLARLEHPNIVPIHSVHPDSATGLQGVCMPYQSAVTLRDVQVSWTGALPTSGAAFSRAVESERPEQLPAPPESKLIARFPSEVSYVQACAWIMHKLAIALEHAHSRGIYHRDLKPSNILLSPSLQPLLVDFNLAFDDQSSGGNASAFFGGTLPYMPPEQLQALMPSKEHGAADVGPRSDIYSLAATVYELLTGQLPFPAPERRLDRFALVHSQLELRLARTPSARAVNSHVPPDFDALLTKCLDPKPENRYESAGQLADDLQRFLLDRPLRHAGATSRRLVARKFLRRNRGKLIAAAAILTMSVATLVSARTFYEIRLERVLSEEQRAEEIRTKEALERERQTQFSALHAELADAGAEECLRKGRTLYMQGKYELAIEALTLCIERNPMWGYPYYLRGKCQAILDNDHQARDDYTKATELDSSNPWVFMERAMLFASSKQCPDPDLAREDVDRAYELRDRVDHSVPAYLHDLARIYAKLSAHPTKPAAELADRAVELLKEAVAKQLPPEAIREFAATDPYNMLDPVLQRPDVQELLESAP